MSVPASERITFAATTKDTIGSGIIRWGLEEPASHFAVIYDHWVYHSTFPEFKREPYCGFKGEIIKAVQFPHLTQSQNLAIIHNIVKHFHGDSYDWYGFLYYTLAAAQRKFFGAPWPDRNKWDGQEPLCTELAEAIFEVQPDLFGTPIGDMAVKSPMWVIRSLEKSGKSVAVLPSSLRA